MRKNIIVCFCFTMLFSVLLACTFTNESYASEIVNVRLTPGESYTCTIQIPFNRSILSSADPVPFKIYSGDEDVAKGVAEGWSFGGATVGIELKINAVGPGATNICVDYTDIGGVEYYFIVNVQDPKEQQVSLCVNEKYDLEMRYEGTSNSFYRSVNNGVNNGEMVIHEAIVANRDYSYGSDWPIQHNTSIKTKVLLTTSFNSAGTYAVELFDSNNIWVASYKVTVIDHRYNNRVVSEATCEKKKQVEYVCENCGDTYLEEEGELIDHTWKSEYTIDKKPTCTEEGSKSIHCEVCDIVKQDSDIEIPKKDHTPGTDATCTEDQTCTVCGTVLHEKLGHKWSEGYIVDKNSTCLEEGTKSIHCEVCDVVKTNSEVKIPKKDHTPGTDATCTTPQVCELCGEIVREKLGHDIISLAPVKAKVGIPGMTGGEKCDRCGETLIAQKKTAGLNPVKTSISAVKKASKAFTVKWKKSTSANCTGYQIRYSTKSNMSGAKTVTVTNYKTCSKKISKLKPKKKYYVQVRCYKKGKSLTGENKTYYSSWSNKKSVTTK